MLTGDGKGGAESGSGEGVDGTGGGDEGIGEGVVGGLGDTPKVSDAAGSDERRDGRVCGEESLPAEGYLDVFCLRLRGEGDREDSADFEELREELCCGIG